MLVSLPRPIAPTLPKPHEEASRTDPGKVSPARVTDAVAFDRFRPTFHLIAPKNWMNDPCGPCFDPTTGLFHLLYQYNPHGARWGNMSWLHATSRDMVHWTHVNREPSLVPSLPHDCQGVFSGAMVPHGPRGESGMLTVFYTAVSHLPIHFTQPYHWGCEKVAMAVSHDGGMTWQRDHTSVLVDAPPMEHRDAVCAWRDPFIAAWPEMDRHLGYASGQYLYGLIAGGLHGRTPTAFLYRIERDDLTRWTYISTVADVGLNRSLGVASGDLGRNWEVCNFFTLQGSQYLLMNVEGVGAGHKGRHPMWMRGDLQKGQANSLQQQSVRIDPQRSGLVDHGCLYAVTTFVHAPTQRRILWGWITEDDLAEARYDQQGWSGCISLPRDVVALTYTKVDASMLTHPLVAPMFDHIVELDGSITLSCIGWRPAAEVQLLRQGARYIALPTAKPGRLPIASRTLELSLEIDASDELDGMGVHLCHDQCGGQGVKVLFRGESMQVIRSHSTSDPDVKTDTLEAPLPLLRFANGTREGLHLRLFIDNSTLEIFVNNRVCLTTRIYCQDQEANLVSLLPSDNNALVPYANVEAWVGLQRAMLDQIDGHQDVVDDAGAHL